MFNKTIILFAALLSFAVGAYAQEDELFNRLPGKWEMREGKSVIIEKWEIVSQSKMAGSSFRVRGNDTTLLETISIERTKEKLNYIPVVKGQNKNKQVRFILHPKMKNGYVFENRKHNFPQRIIYRFITDDSLHARIEGKDKRKYKFRDYYYKRLQ